MKYLILLPLVCVASCASHPQVVVRPTPPPAVEPVSDVRYGELVQTYHVGRYVDPSHPETMHEQHPVYRLEASARWNLHPGQQSTASVLEPPRDTAFAPALTNDALVAEMNRQREVTALVMQEAARLAQSFGELQGVFDEIKSVARNNALLSVRLATNELRMVELAREIQKLSAPPSPATNDLPSFDLIHPSSPNLEITLPKRGIHSLRQTRQMPRNINHESL